MERKMIYPQEIVVWDILPLLRREIALNMKKSGLSQKEIANILGVTEPAISQYFNDKRAKKIKINSNLKDEIATSSNTIIKDKNKLFPELQRLINLHETRKLICNIHKKDFGISKNCKLCVVD